MDKFFLVGYNGNLLIYYKVGENKWHEQSCLDCNIDEEWKLKEEYCLEKKYIGYSEFSEEYAKKMKGFFSFEDKEKAIEFSKKIWNKINAPSAMYNVVRYFDSIFDGYYKSTPMTKKEARKLCDEANAKCKRWGVHYEIKKV